MSVARKDFVVQQLYFDKKYYGIKNSTYHNIFLPNILFVLLSYVIRKAKSRKTGTINIL